MSPRKAGSTKDLQRGKRFKKILRLLFPTAKSESEKARMIGIDLLTMTHLRNWEAGGNIDNRVLGRIHELGGNLGYLLNGEGEPLCPQASETATRQQAETAEALRLIDTEIAQHEALIRNRVDAVAELNQHRARLLNDPTLAGQLLADLALKNIARAPATEKPATKTVDSKA